jgi:hypothetical protein
MMPAAILGRFSAVGCNHGIQVCGPFSELDSADQREQRGHFAALLEDIIKREMIDFIGEEDGSVEETIAEHLAEACNIPHRNINTSNTDKDRMEIPRNYDEGPYTNEQKAYWHRQREQFMLEKIREHRGDARNLLIVCGFTHLERLSGLLQQEVTVQPIDYRKCEWYRAGVFAGGGLSPRPSWAAQC